MPKVSVIMGIYNCERTLDEAIQSLKDQTFSDWELIMCDDGSSDDTLSVANKYVQADPTRYILIQNVKNMGLNCSLNRCLEKASGIYIARMDGDDISLPKRFEAEVQFLDENPDFAIVSSPMIRFDENGIWKIGTAKPYPQVKDFIKGSPFSHAPCMVRAEAYRACNGYSTDGRTLRAEDLDLWFRMYQLGFRGHNLCEPFYMMRDDENAYRRRKFKYCLNEVYVRISGMKKLNLSPVYYVYALRPIFVSLLPKPLYLYLHKSKREARK